MGKSVRLNVTVWQTTDEAQKNNINKVLVLLNKVLVVLNKALVLVDRISMQVTRTLIRLDDQRFIAQ